MALKNKVVLARPNPFIVDEMKGFLVNCGYEPVPIKDLKDLLNIDAAEVAGAVVSNTVVSSVGEKTEEVIAALRQKFPEVPVAIASMVAEDAIEDMLTHKLEKVSANPKVISVAKGLLDHSLGTADTFLVVTQEDMKDMTTSGKIIEQHFPKG